MKLDSLYQEIILDHYRYPHHKGLREPYDAEVRHLNPTCGDEVTLRVRLDGDRVTDVSYDSMGCSISQASTSVLTDLVIGRTLDEAAAIGQSFHELMGSRGEAEPDEDVLEDAVAFAGVSRYPARIKCALLGWMAYEDATTRASAPGDGVGDTGPSDGAGNNAARRDGAAGEGAGSDGATSDGATSDDHAFRTDRQEAAS
jgi:nitrogen fixation NifU-like protein